MNSMRALFILFSCVVLFLVFICPVSAKTSNRIVALVNDEVITLYELDNRVEEMTGMSSDQMRVQDEQQYIEIRRNILEQLIDEKIAREKALELGIQVSDDEVDSYVEELKKANQVTQEEMIEQLKTEGITYERFRERVKSDLERNRLIDYEVRSKAFVREEQIVNYYEAHIDDYKTEGQVRLAGIFLIQSDPSNRDESLELTKKGEEILSRINNGEDFRELAMEFSQGPGADEGGSLGLFKTSEIDQDLLNIIESLPEGGVSDLIHRGGSIQIIKLIKKYNRGIIPLEDVRDNIYETLYTEELNKRYESWMKELRESSFTKINF
jgi:peptidyl-prolyl cis-trans isomerase SurA